MTGKYVDPELVKIAKEQDVFDILVRDGVPMTRNNNEYRHREHDSLVISPNKGFFWFSRDIGSRSPIDYYMEVENMSFPDATMKVLEVMNYDYSNKNVVIRNIESKSPNYITKDFVLPKKAEENKNVYAYLTKTRGIDPEIVSDLINKGLLYQSKKYNNAVFIGKDYDGNIVSAFKRSTRTNLSSTSWSKGDHTGSQKEYRLRIENPTNKVVNIFESEIDMLSYLSMQPKLARNENYIALGGVSDRAALEFLKHNEIEHINICTDNDDKGHEFCKKISEELGREYYITRELPVSKDFNQDLTDGTEYTRRRIEVLTFEEETTMLTKREKIALVNQIFSENYQGKKIDLSFPDTQDFENVDTNAKFNKFSKEHFRVKDRMESNRGYRNRLNIGIEKDLITFLSDSRYIGGSQEVKKTQNRTHKNTDKWHYFNKLVLIDNDLYDVVLDIRQDFENNTFVHKIRLKNCEIENLHEKNDKSSQISQKEILIGEQLSSNIDKITTVEADSQEKKEIKIETFETTHEIEHEEDDFSFSTDGEEFEM